MIITVPYLNDVIATNSKRLVDSRLQEEESSKPFLSRFHFCPTEVTEKLSNNIIGQPQVITAIKKALQAIKVDIRDEDRPLSVMMFVGSTGVGKTETARILSKALTGESNSLCRIDMNTLTQEHYTASITGAPPGYVGSKENNTIFNVKEIEGSFSKPSVVLFDEIEKASKEVIQTLLNVMDSGHLELAGGTKSINFRNSLIFITSNLGAREISQYRKKFTRGWRKMVQLSPSPAKEQKILSERLERFFEPEFLNRIDQTVFFQQLSSDFKQQLLELELDKLQHRLSKKNNASFTINDSAKNHLLSYYDGKYGAREISRQIRTVLEPKIAEALLESQKKSFSIICKRSKLQIAGR